jgi:predicted DNA-binding transcriptional regulator AlpA
MTNFPASETPRTSGRGAVTELEHLIDEIELAKVLGRPVPTLQKDRHAKKGPPYIKIGRHVRYRPSDVEKYLRERTVKMAERR